MRPSSSSGSNDSVRFLASVGRNAVVGIVWFRHAGAGARQAAWSFTYWSWHSRVVAAIVIYRVGRRRRASLVLDWLAGRPVSLRRCDRENTRWGDGGWTSIALLVTAVAWWVWQYRGQANLRSSIGAVSITGWGAVGWWLMPFGNLWKPFRRCGNSGKRVNRSRGQRVDGCVDLAGPRLWWALWIVATSCMSWVEHDGP